MMFLNEMDPVSGFIRSESIRDKGRDLNQSYLAADPFPHVVIDDFLPRSIIDKCLNEFEVSRHDLQTIYNNPEERNKREYKPDDLSPEVRTLFYSLNSRPFLKVIENITGIRGLIPDPYFLGGGFHEIHTGGHLSIHADFNHHKLMNLERRVNVLIYLNDNWNAAYGGQLELWDADMRSCVKSVVPLANRCVIFNTTSGSNHGNPLPVNHPLGVSRKSIALYYYTSTWSAEKLGYNTQFRPRSGTDWHVRKRKYIDDFLPPILRRALSRVRAVVIPSGN